MDKAKGRWTPRDSGLFGWRFGGERGIKDAPEGLPCTPGQGWTTTAITEQSRRGPAVAPRGEDEIC